MVLVGGGGPAVSVATMVVVGSGGVDVGGGRGGRRGGLKVGIEMVFTK